MGFIREFIRNPRQTGSIAASSEPVVRMMLEGLPLANARSVVELGAGTGAVTGALRKALPDDARFVAVELNSSFSETLRNRYAPQGVVVENRSAVDLPKIVKEHQLGELDLVISGLPWTLMTPQDQSAALEAIANAMAPDAKFVTLACLHQSVFTSGRTVRRRIAERFAQVERASVVWAAVPPMIAYRCTSPVKTVTTDPVVNRAHS